MGQPGTFFGNIFCSVFDNPHGKTGCWLGNADCRMSASIYNRFIGVGAESGATVMGLGRGSGYVFNQTLVETRWSKCSYIFDGASGNKYNGGCGRGGISDCKSNFSAFKDICPSTGKTCTVTDQEVKSIACKEYGGDFPIPPTHIGEAQCLFPGVAWNYHGQDDYKPGKEYLRDMIKARIERNDGQDQDGPNIEKWNEVVLDEHLFLPDIWKDPAVAVPAFIYSKAGMGSGSRDATARMRDEYCNVNKVDKIPLVRINDMEAVPEFGPFEPDEEDNEITVV